MPTLENTNSLYILHNSCILCTIVEFASGRSKNKKDTLMLHAYKIKFRINDKNYEYVANLDEVFSKVLKEKNLKNFFL